MRKFWKIFLRSLGTYLGLAGGLSFKRFKVKGCQCAFLMHMSTRFTTEPAVSLGTEILFMFLQVSVWLINLSTDVKKCLKGWRHVAS